MKRPAFQWYPGDWRRDTALQSCSIEARGLWVEMLNLMHDGEPYGHLTAGGVPITPDMLATLTGLPAPRARKLVAELESRRIFSRNADDVIYSRRMVRDEEVRNARAAGGPKSLGNPNVPRPKDGHKDTGKDTAKDPGKDTFRPSLGGSPAVAVAVAVAFAEELSISQPATVADLSAALATDADRTALATVSRKSRSETACVDALAAIVTGNDPATPRPTRAQFGQALRDFAANGDVWSAALFRGYLRRAVASESPENGAKARANTRPFPARNGAGGGARNDAAIDAAVESLEKKYGN